MIAILLVLALPLADLDAKHFRTRANARDQIARTGTVEEINEALKSKLSVEQRHSLLWCRGQITERDVKAQVKLLSRGLPSNLTGWQESQSVIGKDDEARAFYLWLWSEHRNDLENFFASSPSQRRGIAIRYASNVSYYSESKVALAFLFACLTEDRAAVDRCWWFLDYHYGESQIMAVAPFPDVYRRMESKLRSLVD